MGIEGYVLTMNLVNLLGLQVSPRKILVSFVSQVVVVKSFKETLFTELFFSPSVFTVVMITGSAQCPWNEEKPKACLIITWEES